MIATHCCICFPAPSSSGVELLPQRGTGDTPAIHLSYVAYTLSHGCYPARFGIKTPPPITPAPIISGIGIGAEKTGAADVPHPRET